MDRASIINSNKLDSQNLLKPNLRYLGHSTMAQATNEGSAAGWMLQQGGNAAAEQAGQHSRHCGDATLWLLITCRAAGSLNENTHSLG
jgi:hypothetical protein